MSNEEDAGSPLEWSPQYLKADARRLRAELMAKDAELAEVSRQRDQATDGCAELSRALTRAVTAHDQLRADLARVTIERDVCKAEHERLYNDYSALAGVLGAAHTERDALRAEVAALKAGKWVSRWANLGPAPYQHAARYDRMSECAYVKFDPESGWWHWQIGESRKATAMGFNAHTFEDAKAKADAALLAEGRWLEPEIAEQVSAGKDGG